MAPSSNVADDLTLSFINRPLQNLRERYNLILRKEKYLKQYPNHMLWIKRRQKIRRSKFSVAGKIHMLEKLFKELSSGELSWSRQLVTASTEGAGRGRRAAVPGTPAGQENESVGLCEAELRSRTNKNETKEPRYLLVSNGCAICCLDLQQSNHDLPAQPLPKIATLKLLEEGLPVSVGLFKLGSDAFMIGGQKYPALSEGLPLQAIRDWDPHYYKGYSEDPRGYNLYSALCSIYDLKGTSRVTYRLSLAKGCTLSRSGCNIRELNKPKFWPIVEKIKGQVHVFDSVPLQFVDHPTQDWIFSHETLNRDDSWMEIPTFDAPVYIMSHLVVGDRIYGVGDYLKFVLFDSTTNKWEVRPGGDCRNPLLTVNVWQILRVGIARCAGEFPDGGASDPPLYVVVAVVRSAPNVCYGNVTFAVAYLVTSTGEVVCIQRLRRFFKKHVRPWFMEDGKMLDVDEEGKTICAIFTASAIFDGEDVDSDYLFINTFSVEMLSEAAPKVLEVHAKGRKAWPIEQEFVRIDMKQREYWALVCSHYRQEAKEPKERMFRRAPKKSDNIRYYEILGKNASPED